MPTIDFPSNPSVDQTYSFGGRTWVWNGSAWVNYYAQGGGSGMTYPGSGIPNSTGSSWGTSYTTSGSGTVVALTNSPTFSTPNLGTPSGGTLSNCVGLPTLATNATLTAGTNGQGQGTMSSDFHVITTASNNPSGVTLPTPTAGKQVLVVNKGANPVNVYPTVGSAIDGLATNAAVSLPINGYAIFTASSATQWYSVSYSSKFSYSAAITTTSGSVAEFFNIPANIQKITLLFYQVSSAGNSDLFVQLGTSSGFIGSGYASNALSTQNAALGSHSNTGAFNMYVNNAAREISGSMTLWKYSSTVWLQQHQLHCATDTTLSHGAGYLNSISGTIDRVRALTDGNNFDKGSVTAVLEG